MCILKIAQFLAGAIMNLLLSRFLNWVVFLPIRLAQKWVQKKGYPNPQGSRDYIEALVAEYRVAMEICRHSDVSLDEQARIRVKFCIGLMGATCQIVLESYRVAIRNICIVINYIVFVWGFKGKIDSHALQPILNLDAVPISLDREARIVSWSERAELAFGYETRNVLGQSSLGLMIPRTESTGRLLDEAIYRICKNPRGFYIHLNENLDCEGKRSYYLWLNLPIYNEEHELHRIQCYGTRIDSFLWIVRVLVRGWKIFSK
ncbi:MAG: DsrE family protein [Spirulina sp.]